MKELVENCRYGFLALGSRLCFFFCCKWFWDYFNCFNYVIMLLRSKFKGIILFFVTQKPHLSFPNNLPNRKTILPIFVLQLLVQLFFWPFLTRCYQFQGYGDIVPNTYCGRTVTLLCGMVVSREHLKRISFNSRL